MQLELAAAQRLIADVEIKPPYPKEREWMQDQAFGIARQLEGTGVLYIKLESLVRGDYSLIDKFRDLGFKVFADLKLDATQETLLTDAVLLRRHRPEFLSVMCTVGPTAMKALKEALPDTKILGVPVLTNLRDKEVRDYCHGCSIEEAGRRLGAVGKEAAIYGLVSGGKKVTKQFKTQFGHGLFLVGVAIRPEGVIVPNDDQNPDRVMTPEEAMEAGADYLVVGRPITQAPSPREATIQIVEQIDRQLIRMRKSRA